MDKLFTLLELQRQTLEAQTRDSLVHIIVNETRKLIPYDQAVFWSVEGLTLKLEKISGNAILDQQSVYAADLKKSVKKEISTNSTVVLLQPSGAILMFRTGEEGLLGGLWLEYPKPYTDAEKRILDELALIYGQALALWNLRRSNSFFPSFKSSKRMQYAAMATILLLAFFPVRQTITAPAEITAREAEIVTIPFDGVIETAHVRPGDAVKKGDLLVTMEQQSLQAQMDMAQQEMAVVQGALSRVQRESLAAPDKKTQLTELQQEIESKKIAYDFAKDQKERSEIRAAHDGVAVFADANALKGRPARTGDKVMMIADPADYELLVRVPVDSMVPLQTDAPVKFFLNVAPLGGHAAQIKSIGYQASPDADGLLTYKITASLLGNDKDLRIGWKGTAKIKGGWTTISYTILRRPFIALRNMTGI